MADGTYERRGPREAELKRFGRLLAEARQGEVRQTFPTAPQYGIILPSFETETTESKEKEKKE